MTHRLPSPLALAVLVGGALGGACDSSASPLSSSTSALASAVASATETTGVMMCAPQQAQIDACSGSVDGDACTLTDPRGDTHEGTCRASADGSVVACAPTPPAPPSDQPPKAEPRGPFPEAHDACADLAAGDACTVRRGPESATGACVELESGDLACIVACGILHGPFDCRAMGDGRLPDASVAELPPPPPPAPTTVTATN